MKPHRKMCASISGIHRTGRFSNGGVCKTLWWKTWHTAGQQSQEALQNTLKPDCVARYPHFFLLFFYPIARATLPETFWLSGQCAKKGEAHPGAGMLQGSRTWFPGRAMTGDIDRPAVASFQQQWP
jgi:hypothetical protein